MAAGPALATSYTSDLTKVTPENLASSSACSLQHALALDRQFRCSRPACLSASGMHAYLGLGAI
ncbi:hypothetical protein K443DRAFT_672965 [Laccaria amethystina LaAM-08-1]|uniref:Uncharacterized protein n=1 Tax=Laccaria amethystina LaAM-08-1 TaxID=1095629 RepID=A0A0C9YCL7_9AGAR|nr:hypothetical protein K443DRAFT_672965 [Laccaria amethystina LaAM-08-1]